MVLEQVFKVQWLEKRPRYAFVLGFVYALIGILSARLIFKSNTGMMAVAFISILLIPSLNKLLSDEENIEIREKKLSLRLLFKDHRDIFEIYLLMFLGIFVAFSVLSFLFPLDIINRLFAPQLAVANLSGGAILNAELMSILLNNLIVLIACCILSLVYGAGSVLFLTWNASAWGAVIGFSAKLAVVQTDVSPFVFFGLFMLPIIPHLITEAASYIGAAIVGGVLSKAVLREKIFSEKFHHITTDSMLIGAFAFGIVLLAGVLEVHIFPLLFNSVIG